MTILKSPLQEVRDALDWLKFIAEHHDCRKTRIGATDHVKGLTKSLTAIEQGLPEVVTVEKIRYETALNPNGLILLQKKYPQGIIITAQEKE